MAALDRTHFVRAGATLIRHILRVLFHLQIGKFRLPAGMLQVVSPQARLPFHADLADKVIFHVGVFGVNQRGQPQSRLHIHAPAIKMEIEVAAALRLIRAVHADDVVLLIFNPDTAYEVRSFYLFVWNNVEDERAHVAQKFLPEIFQVVVLDIEAVAQEYKLHETFRQVGHLVEAIEPVQYPREHSHFFPVVTQVANATFIEHQTAEEILVARRHLA